MRKKITGLISGNISVSEGLLRDQVPAIESLAAAMLRAIKKGGKILIFGNGGSASDSIHIAAELVGRFRREREALAAIALPANISSLTALGNDYGFERIFERQVEALGKKGDVALGISTSGRSENVVRGVLKASRLKMKTAVLTGRKTGRLSRIADISVRVPSDNTARIQEAHSLVGHIVCEIIEDALR